MVRGTFWHSLSLAALATTVCAVRCTNGQNFRGFVTRCESNIDYANIARYPNGIQKSTTDACAQKCIEEAGAGCKAFVYDGDTCWLKTGRGYHSVTGGWLPLVGAPTDCDYVDATGWTKHCGKNVNGYNIEPIKTAPDLQACMNACAKLTECVAVVYDYRDSACVMRNSLRGAPSTDWNFDAMVKDTNAITTTTTKAAQPSSGPAPSGKTCTELGNGSNFTYGDNTNGYRVFTSYCNAMINGDTPDLKIGVKSHADCISLCGNNPQCNAASYQGQYSRCILFTWPKSLEYSDKSDATIWWDGGWDLEPPSQQSSTTTTTTSTTAKASSGLVTTTGPQPTDVGPPTVSTMIITQSCERETVTETETETKTERETETETTTVTTSDCPCCVTQFV